MKSVAAERVAEAVVSLGLGQRVERVLEPERSKLLMQAKSGLLAVPNATWWWEHLRGPIERRAATDGFRHLPAIAPSAEALALLITDLEEADEVMGIFRCTPADAALLIGECHSFEYALVDPMMRWAVIESHHNVLYATGESRERLRALALS